MELADVVSTHIPIPIFILDPFFSMSLGCSWMVSSQSISCQLLFIQTDAQHMKNNVCQDTLTRNAT